MKTLHLDDNEAVALRSAIDNYLEGHGMSDSDEDEPTLQGIIEQLDAAVA